MLSRLLAIFSQFEFLHAKIRELWLVWWVGSLFKFLGRAYSVNEWPCRCRCCGGGSCLLGFFQLRNKFIGEETRSTTQFFGWKFTTSLSGAEFVSEAARNSHMAIVDSTRRPPCPCLNIGPRGLNVGPCFFMIAGKIFPQETLVFNSGFVFFPL